MAFNSNLKNHDAKDVFFFDGDTAQDYKASRLTEATWPYGARHNGDTMDTSLFHPAQESDNCTQDPFWNLAGRNPYAHEHSVDGFKRYDIVQATR